MALLSQSTSGRLLAFVEDAVRCTAPGEGERSRSPSGMAEPPPSEVMMRSEGSMTPTTIFYDQLQADWTGTNPDSRQTRRDGSNRARLETPYLPVHGALVVLAAAPREGAPRRGSSRQTRARTSRGDRPRARLGAILRSAFSVTRGGCNAVVTTRGVMPCPPRDVYGFESSSHQPLRHSATRLFSRTLLSTPGSRV